MKKLLVIWSIVVFSIFALADSTSQSTRKAFNLSVDTQYSQSGLALMRITVQDSKPKSGVCPYYVRSLQYLEALHVLNVEVFQEACNNEAFGVSTGEVLWIAPKALQAKGTPITIIMNQGQAGSLLFDDSKKTFSVMGD